MKLSFGMKLAPNHIPYWKDGLWAALELLMNQDWKLDNDNPDFRLYWGNPADAPDNADGICYGGGYAVDDIFERFKVVFFENKREVDAINHPNKRLAFGTNTKLFKPINQPKVIDALYPAAFADWKHQEKFAEICKKEGKKGLAVGYMQPDNPDEVNRLVKVCLDNGVGVMDWVPATSLVHLYNMSKEVIITANESGGSQRTVLEAKACNIPVRLETDSPNLLEFKDLTHEDVLKDWSEYNYAQSLKEGILSTLQ